MASLLIVAIASVVSCITLTLSTSAIGRFGGTLGSVLATTPTTVVPYSIGLVLARTSIDDIDTVMFSVPIGLLLLTFYLVLWREVPRWTRLQPLISAYQLIVSVFCIAACWLGGFVLLLKLLPQLDAAGVPFWVSGVVALLLSFLIGMTVIFQRPPPSSPGKKESGQWMQSCPAIGAGVGSDLFTAMVLATSPINSGGELFTSPSEAGMAMTVLWLQRDRELLADAAGPTILGNMAASTYCLLFAVLQRQARSGREGEPVGLMLTAVSLLCYVFATAFVSLPIFALLQWRKTRVESGQIEIPKEQAEGLLSEC